ncbi:hypothetical protein ACFV9W_04945 [Streptomyces sp. NPDC059897]|uniref:hypothetical protein n=1 Tax=Streptomyces sp. NPDC059897 TaxID=3346994 RepID=UPI003659F95D
MIRKVLAGAALASAAVAATVGASGVASATGYGEGYGDAPETVSGGYDGTDTDAATMTGDTTSGTGVSQFATDNGDVAIGGDPGGILNSYGAPLVSADLRCAVPAPQGVGGNVLGGPVAACDDAPVDQFDAAERIL